MGMLPSASLAGLGKGALGLYEPIHGSAPRRAGQDMVNPIATILAAKMMLDWLGETEKAQRVENATSSVIKEGKVRTYDMGGDATTLAMAKAIAARI
jgi:3-isopropylmalate dehydrogenase